MKFSEEFLSQIEAGQHDITAKNAVRLQREPRSETPHSGKDLQKFERATSQGKSENVKILKKATNGVHYLRPVKKSVLLID